MDKSFDYEDFRTLLNRLAETEGDLRALQIGIRGLSGEDKFSLGFALDHVREGICEIRDHPLGVGVYQPDRDRTYPEKSLFLAD